MQSQSTIRLVQFAFVALVAASAYAFVASARDGEMRKSCSSLCLLSPSYVGTNLSAPDISLPDLTGRSRSLSSFRGRTVVVVFWTSTCQSCKQQMRELAEFQQLIANDRRFALLTVAADEDPDRVRAVLRETLGAEDPFPVLLDKESAFVLGRYGTTKFPENWIVDPEGIIRARFDGPRDWTLPVVQDLLRNVSRGDSCPLEVKHGTVSGRGVAVCSELAGP